MNDWKDILEQEFVKDYYSELEEFLQKEYSTYQVYPKKEDIFNAFRFTPYANVKVVILGQDPYHGEGQAHGLSFSVPPGAKKPPSLLNIFKELNQDQGIPIPDHGCLTKWAEEGVLLLNTVLTVRCGEPNSHKQKGWEQFTDNIIKVLNQRDRPLVFILWGKNAQQKIELISNKRHYILKSSHPSPFSARKGFFGSRVFSKVNTILSEEGIVPINWGLITTNEEK